MSMDADQMQIGNEFNIIDNHLLDTKPVRVASEQKTEFKQNKNLLEIFNWYSMRFLQTKPNQDFDSLHQNLSFLSMQGFACFCQEFKVPLDSRAISEVYKRSQVNNQPLQYEQFDKSISKLGIKHNQIEVDTLKKKLLDCRKELTAR